jgi:DASS family divalent anion:Na+ symporter
VCRSTPRLTWFKAACVPAIVGLAVTPYLVFKLFPPEIQETPEAPKEAAEKLKRRGRTSSIQFTTHSLKAPGFNHRAN